MRLRLLIAFLAVALAAALVILLRRPQPEPALTWAEARAIVEAQHAADMARQAEIEAKYGPRKRLPIGQRFDAPFDSATLEAADRNGRRRFQAK